LLYLSVLPWRQNVRRRCNRGLEGFKEARRTLLLGSVEGTGCHEVAAIVWLSIQRGPALHHSGADAAKPTCDYFEMATVNVAGRLGHPRRSLQLSSHVCGDQQQVTAQRHPVTW
jgi:hypothetical protein